MINLRAMMDTETNLFEAAQQVKALAEYGVALTATEREYLRVNAVWLEGVAERLNSQFSKELKEQAAAQDALPEEKP